MPLLDHFHPPLSNTRDWQSFLTSWTVVLANSLNPFLPESRYHTEPWITTLLRRTTQVESFDLPLQPAEEGGPVQPWAPPAPAATLSLAIPDSFEARVIHDDGGPKITGAILLTSPTNKGGPAQRRAFAAKCATYLQSGVGLIVVDIVTHQGRSVHRDLHLIGLGAAAKSAPDGDLCAVAYRPAFRDGQGQLDLWPATLAIGQPLPRLPLALCGAFFVPVDLEATYTEARRHSRL